MLIDEIKGFREMLEEDIEYLQENGANPSMQILRNYLEELDNIILSEEIRKEVK